MKVVEVDSVTIIYPFIKPDSEVVGFREQIVVWPDGTMDLRWDNKVRLDAEAAQTLAEALLHAVEAAEKGRDGAKLDGSPDVALYQLCDI